MDLEINKNNINFSFTGGVVQYMYKYRNKKGKFICKIGQCIFSEGIVLIRQRGRQNDNELDKKLELETMINGRIYYKSIIGKIYTNNDIKLIAHEFIKELK